MYPVSETFKTYIKKNAVSYSWHGTIVDVEENSYSISDENIVQNSGSITKRCSSERLQIGTACASELKLSLYLDVDRYKLFNGVITLYFTLYEGTDEHDEPITEDVPMGIYTISECTQAAGKLSIVAYDNMLKFDDVPFYFAAHLVVQEPYVWLTNACTACGVTFGMTQVQVRALPNGERKTGIADCVSDIKNWRDVLRYITAYLGGYAYIGRDGELYIGTYTDTSVDTIPSSFRYSSNLSDYRTTFDGINAICKNEGIQEYTSNTNTGGMVLELGTNPFLQFTSSDSRLDALQMIIDAWDGIYYVPFESYMPTVPIYDPGDVITFTDNQAAEYDYGAITEIVYSIGGQMHIVCTGENPRLAEAQDRYTKIISSLSTEMNNGQQIGGKDFWMLFLSNEEQITVTSSEIQIAEIEYNQSTYGQRLEMIVTIDAVLSATAKVEVRMTVDDITDLEMKITEDKSFKGERTFHCTNPQKIYGTGTHQCKVYMKVTDSPILVGDLY